jgi:hypothetical protein
MSPAEQRSPGQEIVRREVLNDGRAWLEAAGRFTKEQVAATRAEAMRITDELDAGRRWWSDEWMAWPGPDLADTNLPNVAPPQPT